MGSRGVAALNTHGPEGFTARVAFEERPEGSQRDTGASEDSRHSSLRQEHA